MLPLLVCHRRTGMGGKTDVWQGTLALMVLKTLQVIGPQHGYGLARRIEQTSGDLLELNYGALSGAERGSIRGKAASDEPVDNKSSRPGLAIAARTARRR